MAKSEDEKTQRVADKLTDLLMRTAPKPTAKEIFLANILNQTEKELVLISPTLAINQNILCVGDSPEKVAPAYIVAKMYSQNINAIRAQGSYLQNSDAIAKMFTDVGFLRYRLEQIFEQCNF